jgi:hypothetical protein
MSDASANTARPKIPVFRTAYDGYRLGIGAIFSSGAMFRYFIYGSVLSLAVLAAETYLLFWTAMNLSETATNILALVIPLATYVALTAAQTPLGIAIQRQLLLGEDPHSSYATYALNYRGRTYGMIFLMVCGFYFVASLIEIPITFAVYGQPFAPIDIQGSEIKHAAYSSFMLLAWIVTFAGASWMSAKCAFMFPAVACDRPGSWREFYAETRGIVWALFTVFLFAFLPVAMLYIVVFTIGVLSSLGPLTELRHLGADASNAEMNEAISSIVASTPFIVACTIAGLGYMLSFVVTSAAAVRAYQIRVERGLYSVAEVFA